VREKKEIANSNHELLSSSARGGFPALSNMFKAQEVYPQV
jgi:hypothetical protein